MTDRLEIYCSIHWAKNVIITGFYINNKLNFCDTKKSNVGLINKRIEHHNKPAKINTFSVVTG